MQRCSAIGALELTVAVGRNDLVVEVHAERRHLIANKTGATAQPCFHIYRTFGVQLLILQGIECIAVERRGESFIDTGEQLQI